MVGRVLALGRTETWRIVLGTFFMLVGAGMGLIFPQAIRLIVDRASGQGDARWTLEQATLGLLGVAAVQAISGALRTSLFGIAGERVVTRLRGDVFEHLLAQEVAFFDERRTGELTSRLASDAAQVQGAATVNLSWGLRSLAQVIGGIAFLLFTSARLTGVMLAVVPVVALGAVAYGRRVRRLARDAQDGLANASEIADEALGGIRTVRAFAAEPREVTRYRSALWAAFSVAQRKIVAGASFSGVSMFAAYSALAVVLWYGGVLVERKDLSIGSLTAFLAYTLMVALGLGSLSELWAGLMQSLGASERIFELLDRTPTIPLTEGATLADMQGRIDIEGVSFSYPSRSDVPILREIDVTIRPGEVVALVGSSGAGKSTIAALLLRAYDPTGGTIRVDGEDIRALSPTWLRQQIGVVPQEPLLFSCSIADNIRYGREDGSDAEVEAAASAAHVHEFVAGFPEGYRTLVGERGVKLSGGQKQRVAIARAMLKNPRILILDEATSALDAESEHLVKDALERLMKGRTTLVIAHRLSTVRSADRVLVMEGGRVVQSGDHGSLMREEGLYRRLVERQLQQTEPQLAAT